MNSPQGYDSRDGPIKGSEKECDNTSSIERPVELPADAISIETETHLPVDPEKAESSDSDQESIKPVNTRATEIHRTCTMPWTEERLKADEMLALEKAKTTPIMPLKTAENIILVDW